MTIDRMILAFAGFFVLLSLALGWEQSPLFHSTNWLWFTAFVGLTQMPFPADGDSPLAKIPKALAAKPACPQDN